MRTLFVTVAEVRYTINNAEDQRRLLLDAMVALVEGRINVAQANALANLSGEVHKSIRQQFDMLCYASDNFTIGPGNQVMLVEEGDTATAEEGKDS